MCTLDFCGQTGRNKDGAGLCEAHYYQQRRGRLLVPVQPKTATAGDPCAADGCKNAKASGRYCAKHAARIARHGDPDKVTQAEDRNMLRGEANPMWTASPGYFTVHGRLTRERGRAADHACGDCGNQAAQWSYVGQRKPGEQWPFSTDLSMYVARCVSCHKTADLAALAALRA